jgi:uncharacterized membrane protein YcjF (UPF0283 family)
MSTTEQQSTGQSRQREQGSSQRQQRRADSDHRRRQDEDKQEKKSEQKEEKKQKPDFMKKFAGALPLIIGLGFCVAFFVWVCLQMAGQTVGGPKLLVGIFGGAVLGIAAAGAGVGIARLADRED